MSLYIYNFLCYKQPLHVLYCTQEVRGVLKMHFKSDSPALRCFLKLKNGWAPERLTMLLLRLTLPPTGYLQILITIFTNLDHDTRHTQTRTATTSLHRPGELLRHRGRWRHRGAMTPQRGKGTNTARLFAHFVLLKSENNPSPWWHTNLGSRHIPDEVRGEMFWFSDFPH